jgi:centrosomal protein CEP120
MVPDIDSIARFPLNGTKSGFRPELKVAFSVSPAKTRLDFISPTASPVRPPVYLSSPGASLGLQQQDAPKQVVESRPLSPSKPDLENPQKVPLAKVAAIQEIPSKAESLEQVRASTVNVGYQPTILKKPALSQLSISFQLTPEGFYQIGTPSDKNQDYILWITIAFAQNLDKLFPYELEAQTLGSFYFYYHFLGVDFVTQPFKNLVEPNFPAERVSIRFRGEKSQINTLLREIGSLQFHFCKENMVFGQCWVPWTSLVSKVTEQASFPIIVEGVYPMDRDQSPSLESRADIGVSLAISLSSPSATASSKGITVETSTLSVSNQKVASVAIPVSATVSIATQPSPVVMETETIDAAIQKTELYLKTTQTEYIQPPTTPQNPSTLDQKQFSSYDSPLNNYPTYPSLSQENLQPSSLDTLNTMQGWHQFRFSIELRSIKDFKLKSANIFLKYTYAPFGSSSPYLTHPVVQFTAIEGETLLPHSFCSFEFVMSPRRLETYLESVPLVIEVYHKDTNRKNILIGSCAVDLGQVSDGSMVPTSRLVDADQLKSVDIFTAITSQGPAAEKFAVIGDLRTLLALEDFGPVKENKVHESKDIYSSLEYQTALELEIWRQTQQELFDQGLRARQKELEEELALKFQQKEAESDAILNEKLQEYNHMISQLQTLSDRLQDRESTIERAERDLAVEKASLEREAGASLQSQRDAARRLEESFAYSNSLFMKRAEDAERKTELTVQERDAFRQKLLEMELRMASEKNDDGEKNSEIAKLGIEIQSLHAQNERLVSSRHDMKKKYKTLFRLYNTFKITAEKQALELESFKKSQYESVFKKNQIELELQEIERENLELKNLDMAAQALKAAVTPAPEPPLPPPMDPAVKSNLNRLEREKQSLLETGVYTLEDALIQEIDSRIKALSQG